MSDLMHQQAKDGHQVAAIVHHHELNKRFTKEAFMGCEVFRVPIWGRSVFVPIAPSFYTHLNDVVAKFKPDIIHHHMPNVACFNALLLKNCRHTPWVVHWHSDVLGAQPDWRVKMLYPFYRIVERKVLKHAGAIIATSPPYLSTSKPLKDYAEKCEVIPLGVKRTENQQPSHPIRSASSDTKRFQLLCIGRLTYYKGHQYLLQAMHLVSQKHETNIELLLVGDGELKVEIETLIAEYGLSDSVTCLGSVDFSTLHTLLNECDVLVLPSIERTEAFGVVLLEAMRSAKACIVTNVEGSGMSWVVQDEKTGRVVNSQSASALADAIYELEQARQSVHNMGQAGRVRLEQEFAISVVSKQIENLYLRCL